MRRLSKNEVRVVNTGSLSTGGRVQSGLIWAELTSPVSTEVGGEKMSLFKKIEKHWHLIGWGQKEEE